MSAEAVVELRGVSKRYGAVEALKAVDARVGAGITAVVGVSGSGKSTLLRLVAGHDEPSDGSVLMRGRDLARLSGRELAAFRRSAVTYVSQRAADNVFPQLSLAEHLRPGSSRRPFEVLGIADRLDARAGELSGGELSRAAFAIALARDAPVVVVDEPTAELDRTTAADVLAAMRDASARGQTFVVATHDPDVVAVADEVIDLTRRHPTPPAAGRQAAPTREVALAARSLRKSYGGRVVLHDVSLEVHRGELAVVVGRSGSGKSSLLMLAGGWLEPDSGSVVPAAGLWHELAYVPQRFALLPELTVRENVELSAWLAQVGPAPTLLEELALVELADRLPSEISVGQQQRVAVARALRLGPRVLLVDEPTSHQDEAHAELVWAALAGAASAGTACLVATHELDARNRAGRSFELVDGRLS